MDENALHTALATLIAELFAPQATARRAALLEAQRAALLSPEGGSTLHARADATAGCAVLAAYERARGRVALVGMTPVGRTNGCVVTALYDALESELAAQIDAPVAISTGGPAGAYLISGLDEADGATRAALEARGFAPRARHVDLHAALAPPREAPDPRVRRAAPREADAVCAWVAARFAPAWGREVRRAFAEGGCGVFVAGEGDETGYRGFAAHSGNNAALGTFGPLGVEPTARGSGLGAALARAALDDLARRGFERATIPWVDPALVPFYAALVARVEVSPRVVLRKTLAPAPAR